MSGTEMALVEPEVEVDRSHPGYLLQVARLDAPVLLTLEIARRYANDIQGAGDPPQKRTRRCFL